MYLFSKNFVEIKYSHKRKFSIFVSIINKQISNERYLKLLNQDYIF